MSSANTGQDNAGAPADEASPAPPLSKDLAKMNKLARKWWTLIGLSPLIMVLDQWTKSLIVEHFRYGESLPIVKDFFDLTYVRNTGAAFGMFADAHPEFRVPFFLVVPIVALIAIGIVFKKLHARDLLLSSALSLVIAGAIGNLIDRLRLGYVVDFLDFHWSFHYHFPAFNVADSAICVGVAILMFDLTTQKDPGKNASSPV